MENIHVNLVSALAQSQTGIRVLPSESLTDYYRRCVSTKESIGLVVRADPFWRDPDHYLGDTIALTGSYVLKFTSVSPQRIGQVFRFNAVTGAYQYVIPKYEHGTTTHQFVRMPKGTLVDRPHVMNQYSKTLTLQRIYQLVFTGGIRDKPPPRRIKQGCGVDCWDYS